MGKDFLPLRVNGATDSQIWDVYHRLKNKPVIEASKQQYFHKKHIPPVHAVEEIEIGEGSTKQSVIRFTDGNWVVFEGKVRLSTIFEPMKRR